MRNGSSNVVESADKYFQERVWDNSAWEELSQDYKRRVLNTATDDVNAYLRTQNIGRGVKMGGPPFSFYEKAIFEWAIYLVSNRDEISKVTADAASGVIERTVEGFGKERYYYGGGKAIDGRTKAMLGSPAGRMLGAIGDDLRIVR